MAEYVKVARGPVARVTIDRPGVHNAFNEQVIAELHEAFVGLSRESRVRVVVLASEGRSFSAGADLDWMRRAAGWSEEQNRQDAAALAAMLRSVAECRHPVLARVQGNAFGGGVGLIAAADIAIAAKSARFGFTEVRLGLVPATIAPHVIDKIGAGRALPLFLSGELFDAAYAQRIGLVHRVAPDDELDHALDLIVSTLREAGPAAQEICKRLVRRVARRDQGSVDFYTAELIARVRTSGEGREGVSAFLEKRKPSWTPAVETARRGASGRDDESEPR